MFPTDFFTDFLAIVQHMAYQTPAAALTAAIIGGGIFYKEKKNKKLGADQQVVEYISVLSLAAAITGSVAAAILLILI